ICSGVDVDIGVGRTERANGLRDGVTGIGAENNLIVGGDADRLQDRVHGRSSAVEGDGGRLRCESHGKRRLQRRYSVGAVPRAGELSQNCSKSASWRELIHGSLCARGGPMIRLSQTGILRHIRILASYFGLLGFRYGISWPSASQYWR